MPWTLGNDNMEEAGAMKGPEKKQFNDWASAVAKGKHPKTAANGWDSHYEVLKKKGKIKRCSIRLSESNRIFFIQDDGNEHVDVVRVGDHKEPKGF